MPCLITRDVRLILGKTGSGKTTLGREFVNCLPRALIIDKGFLEFSARHFLDLDELHKYLDQRGGPGGNFRASISPRKSDYDQLFRWALELGQAEEITLVLEECDRFPTPDSQETFSDITERGRHFGVHVLSLGTHPCGVDIDLRRQATEIYSFRQHEPADIKWLTAVMPSAAMEQIINLGDYEFIRWEAQHGTITKGKTKK